MTGDAIPLLERFHQVLVEEIRSHSPRYLSEPFTIAEIYQNLVPYRTHRDEIGIEMAGDYEDALLRLLAGEGGFLMLESESARKQIAKELEAPDPNPAVVRRFAAAEVRLNPALVPSSPPALRVDEAKTPAPELAVAHSQEAGVDQEPELPLRLVESEITLGAHVEEEPAVKDEERPDLDRLVESRLQAEGELADQPHQEAYSEVVLKDCPWCSESLPRRGDLRFCHFCGHELGSISCASCGADLEPGWRFCIACGAERGEP